MHLEEEHPFDESLSDMLSRARAGDVLAARDALEICAWAISLENKHPRTGEPLPVPSAVREYLSQALASIAAGNDPAKALYLKRPGPKVWRFEDKLRGAYLVAQLVDQGVAVDEAKEMAAEALADLQQKARSAPERKPVPLGGLSVSGDTLRTWYFELKGDLTRRGL